MTNDLISDMLTRIRNANLVKLPKVNILQTDLTISISNILKEEGFIDSFETNYLISNVPHLVINLKFKNLKQKPYITSLKRVSKPGIRVYVKASNIPKVLGGVGIVVLSTSKGVMTDRVARIKNVGGEVLFYIW
uniref:Small ribosomal subunit protein uS8c n=1 Tax=Phacus inflexus TaxID=461210 RepID=A0A3G3LKT5_9EUGL|nr:ribosomal protein S8 [Phacus inflexus]AYQ93319.1 ribosomal protein S8 [Phacus inflexus]